MATARISGWRAMTFTFGADAEELACLYVAVDDDAFLRAFDHCGDRTSWDWRASGRTLDATIGIEVLHGCGSGDVLRLEFDLTSDRAALDRLRDTEALVLGTSLTSPLSGPLAAVGVQRATVRAVVDAADRGLQLAAAGSN